MIKNIQSDKIEKKQWKFLPETFHLPRHLRLPLSITFTRSAHTKYNPTHRKLVLLPLLHVQCQGDGFNDLIGLCNLSNICEMATVNVEQEIAEIAHLYEMDNIS